MRHYIGTKRVKAEPETRDDKEGYLVEYPDGYQSWSPKDVFEAAYQTIDGMSFGHAIEMLKAGSMVRRAGWNGKSMTLELIEGVTQEGISWLPYIQMTTVQGDLVPWLASQTDVLANDWQVV